MILNDRFFLLAPHTHDRFFFLHTFNLQHLILITNIVIYSFCVYDERFLFSFKEAEVLNSRRLAFYINIRHGIKWLHSAFSWCHLLKIKRHLTMQMGELQWLHMIWYSLKWDNEGEISFYKTKAVVLGQLPRPLFALVTYKHMKNWFTHLLDRSLTTACLKTNFF